FANQALMAAHKYAYTDFPCWTQLAITVQIRSLQRRPPSLRVPCVMCRSITTKRMACSARLLVGSIPGVVRKVKYASAVLPEPLGHILAVPRRRHLAQPGLQHTLPGRLQSPLEN